jgi:hypothetical protein
MKTSTGHLGKAKTALFFVLKLTFKKPFKTFLSFWKPFSIFRRRISLWESHNLHLLRERIEIMSKRKM